MVSKPLPLAGEECRRRQLNRITISPSGQCASATRCPKEESTTSQPGMALTATWRQHKTAAQHRLAAQPWIRRSCRIAHASTHCKVGVSCVGNRIMPPAVSQIRIPNMIEPPRPCLLVLLTYPESSTFLAVNAPRSPRGCRRLSTGMASLDCGKGLRISNCWNQKLKIQITI